MGDGLFIDYLASVSAEIDGWLHRYLGAANKDQPRQRYLYSILDEFIARGGKRTRPAMAMLGCEAVGGDPRLSLSGGCAIEFFHAAALIHDDIMDASVLRRGEKCAHILHGVPLAINAGDYALGLVCTIVVRDPLLDDATKLAVLDVIGEMSERTVEGQALDVGWVGDEIYDLAPNDYLSMALGKTGFYSGIAPLKVGAIVGKATEEQIQALVDFGGNVSIAFQIQDDLLNIAGDEKTMGKDHLTDVLESKRTLMVVHALSTAGLADRQRLIRLLRLRQDKTSEHVAEVLAILERCGSIDYARDLARELVMEGRSHLRSLPQSRARDVLGSMAGYFLERDK
jgi:geranylgeranyl diphosphate synthase type I